MKRVRQRIVHHQYGDCFPACLASLLELPIEVIPNDHSHYWMAIQRMYLEQFGLEITFHNADGPIWSESPWIASVKSKNYVGGTHAILMQGHEVLFDPSTKPGYKKGTSLLGEKVVTGGYIIRVADFLKLHELDEYRNRLNRPAGVANNNFDTDSQARGSN
jgi:hypothetical protein